MQSEIDNGEKVEGGAKGRRLALGVKIALGQVTEADGLISEDDAAQALFDMGFEVGNNGVLQDIIHLLQGVLSGLEQHMHDGAANDNQEVFDFE